MNKLVYKDEKVNKLYFLSGYFFNAELKLVYSSKYGRMTLRKPYRKKIYNYYAINDLSLSEKKMIKWHNEWVELGSPELPLHPNRKVEKSFISIKRKKEIEIENHYTFVNKFLYHLKDQNWLLTIEDVFILIDCYSKYYPKNDIVKTFSNTYGNFILRKIIQKHKSIEHSIKNNN